MKKYLLIFTLLLFPLSSFAVTPTTSTSWDTFNSQIQTGGSTLSGFYIIPYGSGHTCTNGDIADAGSAFIYWYHSGTTVPTNQLFSNWTAINTWTGVFPSPDPVVYYCLLYSLDGSGTWNADNSVPFQLLSGGGGGGGGGGGTLYSTTTYPFAGTIANDFAGMTMINLQSIIDWLPQMISLGIGALFGLINGMSSYMLVWFGIVLVMFMIVRAFKFFYISKR